MPDMYNVVIYDLEVKNIFDVFPVRALPHPAQPSEVAERHPVWHAGGKFLDITGRMIDKACIPSERS